jgi:hypothetical protein
MIGSLTPSEQTTAIKEVFATSDVRTLIANHLGISVGRVEMSAASAESAASSRTPDPLSSYLVPRCDICHNG